MATTRILGIVDLHWSGNRELKLPDCSGYDLVLIGGDLTNFRGVDQARTIVERIREQGPPVLAVCGNCDHPEIESYLDEQEIGLDRRARLWRGIRFLGLSAGLPFGNLPYERTEGEYAKACEELWEAAAEVDASGPTILVSHQPPFGTKCDRAGGRSVGSRSIRESIEKHEPDLVFSGHIHESVAEDRLGPTKLVNPGPWFEKRFVEITVADDEIEVASHQL